MKKINNRKKLIIKLIILFFCIVLIYFIVKNTFSRFQSDADVVAKLDAAFYIVDEDYQTMTINLDSIVPRDDPYVYNFSISNTDGTNRAEVNLEYDLKIVTTTNLPLEYVLYKNGNTQTNIINNRTIEPDEYGTYFLTLDTDTEEFEFTKDETNTYRLEIYFAPTYKDISYQDIIEGIEIQVNSKQIISQ
jgi:hypothetical protein